MNRPIIVPILFGAVTFGAGVFTLAPATADAAWRRVTATTACQEDEAVWMADWDHTFSYSKVSRVGTGLHVNFEETGVRCYVPTDSWFSHTSITEAHVAGKKSAANGHASYVKACATSPWDGTYACGSYVYLPSNNFNVVIPTGNVWNDVNMHPSVVASLDVNDVLYGLYYTNL